MILNDEEKSILQGDKGFVPQICMQYLVEEGEVSGAERLIDLDGTADMHTPQTSMSPHYTFSLEELRKLVAAGAKFKVPTYANKAPFPCTMMHGWEKSCFPPHDEPAFHEERMQKDYMDLYRQMGMLLTHSCDYYIAATYWPSIGQHCAWNESSAIPWCNAVLGARANIDGNFASAFLGKAPYYGMHITENRYATVVVDSERKITSDLEWDLFGFAVGEDCGLAVPALINTSKPTTTQFCKFNSAANTGGSIHMYHIPGSTPEAPTLEYALGGREAKRTIRMTDADLKKAYETLNWRTSDDIDMVYLGCPHLNMVDLMMLARKLEGKKVKVPMWIMTIPWLYQTAVDQGYKKIFDDAGAILMTGTCPALMGGVPKGVRHLAVDSAKQSYYITGCYPDYDDYKLEVAYGTQSDCVDAALTGKWRGEWR